MIIVRSNFLHSNGDSLKSAFEFFPSYEMLISDTGVILEFCKISKKSLKNQYPEALYYDYSNYLTLPGFIDTHLHMPQLNMIGCYGETLLTWLKKYTFKTEALYSSNELAAETSQSMYQELLSHGTTTSVVFSSAHVQATDMLFKTAQKMKVRSIIGKVSIDDHAYWPMDPVKDYEECEYLIKKWHLKDSHLEVLPKQKLFYALTPRFALSCSNKMLKMHGKLHEKYPSCYIQTHISENKNEIKETLLKFKKAKNYLEVYDHAGLLNSKTILAHGIYLNSEERKRIVKAKASVSHCPSSNLFLGSGLFDASKFLDFSLGSDVGGGSHPSLWRTMAEAYNVSALLQKPIAPAKLLHHATVGGAKALGLENGLGLFKPGFEADFQVLDLNKIPLFKSRFTGWNNSIPELFLAMVFLSDARMHRATFVQGVKLHESI